MRLLILRRSSCVFRWMAIIAVLVVPQALQAKQWHATVGAHARAGASEFRDWLPRRYTG